MDETDVDSYFYLNIFDISQSKHRIVRVRRGSNKKCSAFNSFQFCELKTQHRYFLLEVVNIFKTKLSSLVDSLRDVLETLEEASESLQNPLPKSKTEVWSTKSRDHHFAHYYNDITELLHRQIRLSFRFGKNNSCVFSIKKFELHGNHFILTDIVNLNHRKIHRLYKNRY